MKEKTIRQSNYELMRIVSMFFIVFWHVLLHTNAVINSTGVLKYVSLFLWIGLSVHTNTFMLVTGYFQYDKKFKLNKIFRVVGTTWFYNIILTCLGFFILHYEYSHYDLFQSMSIFNRNGYWYITGYVLLMFFSPILNKFIENASQKEHKNVLIMLFILFSIIPYLTKNTGIANDGRSVFHFIFLYLIGAYLAKYPIEKSYHFKKNSISKNRLIYWSIFFSCTLISFLILQFGYLFENVYGSLTQGFYDTIQFTRDNFASPFTVIASIAFFSYFGTLDFKSKLINKISSLTLGVYLIHENKVMARYIYTDFISQVTANDTVLILFKFILYAIIIFIVSAIIEWIRQLLAKMLSKTKLVKALGNKWNNYVKNF